AAALSFADAEFPSGAFNQAASRDSSADAAASAWDIIASSIVTVRDLQVTVSGSCWTCPSAVFRVPAASSLRQSGLAFSTSDLILESAGNYSIANEGMGFVRGSFI